MIITQEQQQNCILPTFLMDSVNWKYFLIPGEKQREKVIYGIEDRALGDNKNIPNVKVNKKIKELTISWLKLQGLSSSS